MVRHTIRILAHSGSPASSSLTGPGRVGTHQDVRCHELHEFYYATNSITDKKKIASVVSEVERIARSVGFGQVTIVIEKGRPRWLEAGTREWFEPREGRRRVGSELQM